MLFNENPFYKNWYYEEDNDHQYLLTYILQNEDLDDYKLIQERINFIENYDFKEIISKYELNESFIIFIVFTDNNSFKTFSKLSINSIESNFKQEFQRFSLEDQDKVKELTPGNGADIIYDPVGGDVFDESVRCIAWNGRLLVIGFTSGRIPTIGANMPLIKGFSVVGVRGGEYGRRDPEMGKKNLEAIDNLASEGKLNPHIHKTYSLENTIDALNELRNRTVIGKVCIKP